MQKLTFADKDFFARPRLAVLVDPDRFTEEKLKQSILIAKDSSVDLILVGGSIIFGNIDKTIYIIKELCDIPVYIFPGNAMHISPNADGLFFLSLISGRNPEFLIGNHVVAAPMLMDSSLDVVPVGYILIAGNGQSSVEYISNTSPIPAGKTDIAIATAVAGELLGLRMIYLEAGSGAPQPVRSSMINQVKQHITVPLIVGGGIRSGKDVYRIFSEGANMVVIGSAVEEDPNIIREIAGARNKWEKETGIL
jgi:putative glycerol-1-phosphate prenyltransferase